MGYCEACILRIDRERIIFYAPLVGIYNPRPNRSGFVIPVTNYKNMTRVLQQPPPPLPGGIVDPTNQIGTPVTSCPVNSMVTVTEKITDSVKNACLRSMVEATISSNITSQINSIIQKVFGGSATMNISFVDVNTLPSNADGFTNTNGGIINGVLNVQIQLDNNHLPSYSQQYIARVIMHEALHAY
jgi:hypothetical protein